MPSHDFGSFKKYFWAKMANLWMIQDSHFDHIFPVFAHMTLKLSENDDNDDLDRFRMPSHDF